MEYDQRTQEQDVGMEWRMNSTFKTLKKVSCDLSVEQGKKVRPKR